MTLLNRYSPSKALFLQRPMGRANVRGQGGVGKLLQSRECLRILPRPGESPAVSRCGRPSPMMGFDRSVRRGFLRSLLPLLRVTTKRRQEWEFVSHDHFFRLFILSSLDNGRNLGKKEVQNTLLSASVPQAFKMKMTY